MTRHSNLTDAVSRLNMPVHSTKHLVLNKDDPNFPRKLRELSDPPEKVFVAGQFLQKEIQIAVVGARAALQKNMELAFLLGQETAQLGGALISGGAMGIDGAAHKGALEKGGYTVAVLGTGLEQCYPPRHRSLFEEIKSKGALVSEYPDDAPAKPWQFVKRNRLIAGLADWVIVVQANLTSGALHTARAATQYGKKLAAVPGSRGCDNLIESGAMAIESQVDLRRALMGTNTTTLQSRKSLSRSGNRILRAMNRSGITDLGSLCEKTGSSPGTLLAGLAELAFEGLVLDDNDAQFWMTDAGKHHIDGF